MSREHLYRAKRVNWRELPKKEWWVEGFLMDENYINIPFNDDDVGGRFDEPIEIDPETVCEYTGLPDKNSRKMFEADIIKTSKYGVDDGKGHNFAGFDMFYIVFREDSFCLKNKWRKFNLRHLGEYEVVGNIIDNTELLEVDNA